MTGLATNGTPAGTRSYGGLLLWILTVVAVLIPIGFIWLAFNRLTGLWQLMSIVFASGALGGVISSLLSDQGFALPGRSATGGNENAAVIIRPGFFGNVLIGAVAAVASWGLYGTFATHAIVTAKSGKPSAPMVTSVPNISGSQGSTAASETFDLPLSALVSAFLIGVGGTRWLSSEVDKKVLAAAASRAAGSQPDAVAARRMAGSSPSGILAIADGLKPAE